MSRGSATFDFTGTRVLVTGGSSGIGLATATAFADAGAHVTITGTRPDAEAYEADLRRFDYRQLHLQSNEEIRSVADSLDALDVLVNNAGGVTFAEPGRAVEVFEEMVRVHLLSAHHMADACLEKLTASELPGGASVVGIASLTSWMSNPFVPGYGAGKAGLVQLARTQSALWADRGIRSNCVAAGYTTTKLTAPVLEMEELNQRVLQRTAMRRWGSPAEMADAVLFLSSDRASFITGETLVVDGCYLYNE
jgi:NAD(P)-dependent dehydrogenase (short-subunit alcohol dehydrogenase family)